MHDFCSTMNHALREMIMFKWLATEWFLDKKPVQPTPPAPVEVKQEKPPRPIMYKDNDRRKGAKYRTCMIRM